MLCNHFDLLLEAMDVYVSVCDAPTRGFDFPVDAPDFPFRIYLPDRSTFGLVDNSAEQLADPRCQLLVLCLPFTN
jgi:hypothetical protein